MLNIILKSITIIDKWINNEKMLINKQLWFCDRKIKTRWFL